jgi:hypothetical protein
MPTFKQKIENVSKKPLEHQTADQEYDPQFD